MPTIANILNGRLGTLIGDAEMAIMKMMRQNKMKTAVVEGYNGDSYDIRVEDTPGTLHAQHVTINSIKALNTNAETVLNALEALETSLA